MVLGGLCARKAGKDSREGSRQPVWPWPVRPATGGSREDRKERPCVDTTAEKEPGVAHLECMRRTDEMEKSEEALVYRENFPVWC